MSPHHQSLTEFLTMGGYGTFVWSAYAIVAVTLVLNAVVPILHYRKLHRSLRWRLKVEAEDKGKAT